MVTIDISVAVLFYDKLVRLQSNNFTQITSILSFLLNLLLLGSNEKIDMLNQKEEGIIFGEFKAPIALESKFITFHKFSHFK